MIIRPENPSDQDAIRQVLIAAFADHPFSHQTEHLIVEALRADDALTVSLVAEVDGNVLALNL
jgi:putative acetyltransferase